jgi:hypothetical protein
VLKFFINIVNNSFSKFSKNVNSSLKLPAWSKKMFIKSKLLAWSAKSRKTPGMECKVQINSWHGSAKFVQINSWHGVQS